MASAANITAATETDATGILIAPYADGTVVSFDTRQPEARAAILASLDRLASNPLPAPKPNLPPLGATLAERAAFLNRDLQRAFRRGAV